TAVNTITHEYLLEFTSEYGIPKALRPELPGPGDRIVDFPEGKVGVYTRPRTSIKGQILADFLNETPSNDLQSTSVAKAQEEPWTLFTDGSSCVDGSGAGLILTNPDGIEFTYALRFQFAASNNEAEYEALIVCK
nr:reverse transcriptase domain-containing protein [Tanacetum cinerariifolium]